MGDSPHARDFLSDPWFPLRLKGLQGDIYVYTHILDVGDVFWGGVLGGFFMVHLRQVVGFKHPAKLLEAVWGVASGCGGTEGLCVSTRVYIHTYIYTYIHT